MCFKIIDLSKNFKGNQFGLDFYWYLFQYTCKGWSRENLSIHFSV